MPDLYRADAILVAGVLFVAMAAAGFGGARLAARRRGTAPGGLAAIETGLFALLGLLLAFTFSNAESRYDRRGVLMTEAAGALRTVAALADLYPPDERTVLRAELADYLETQVALYRAERDEAALAAVSDATHAAQQRLWQHVSTLARDPAHAFESARMVEPLQRVFALALDREVAARLHLPDAIVLLLFAVACATACASGYASGLAAGFHGVAFTGFAALVALVVYVTLDLDRPGRGLIRRDVQEQAIESIRPLLVPTAPAR